MQLKTMGTIPADLHLINKKPTASEQNIADFEMQFPVNYGMSFMNNSAYGTLQKNIDQYFDTSSIKIPSKNEAVTSSPQTNTSINTPSQSEAVTSSPKTNMFPIIIAVIVIVVALIVGLIIYMFTRPSSTSNVVQTSAAV